MSSNTQFDNPQNYSVEAWFKTTYDQGGKIIGFGCSQTGLSGCYDRHIYLTNDGRVTFGVYRDGFHTTTAPTPVNDGQWHHVVASQSLTEGMKLYVDGVLVGADPQGTPPYAGYWRVGGDTGPGTPSSFLTGTIDEAAVYLSVLPASRSPRTSATVAGVPNVRRPRRSRTPRTADVKVSSTAPPPPTDGTHHRLLVGVGRRHGGTRPDATASHTYARGVPTT